VAGLTVSVPLTSCVPVHPLLAVQLVVLALLQLRVLVSPAVMVAGSAVTVNVGDGGAVTVTIADWVRLPPAPLQVRV
jgi:hypothetical protein